MRAVLLTRAAHAWSDGTYTRAAITSRTMISLGKEPCDGTRHDLRDDRDDGPDDDRHGGVRPRLGQGPGKVAVCTKCPNMPVPGIWLPACTNAVAWHRATTRGRGASLAVSECPLTAHL